MPRRIFVDTEWTAPPWSDHCALMWIGLADGVRGCCGPVDEFCAWIPPLDRFAAWFRLSDAEAPALYARHRDVDLHMLQALVTPWPTGWPQQVHELQAAAIAAGVEPPPRAADHLHPRVHATWDRTLFQRIQAAGGA